MTHLLPDQPPPTPGTGDLWRELIDSDPTWDAPRTIAMCEERRLLGIARYGTPLQRDNGRDYDVDLIQELLDAAVYAYVVRLRDLRVALAEVDRLTAALAEAEATLANERGEGDPPEDGWRWLSLGDGVGTWDHENGASVHHVSGIRYYGVPFTEWRVSGVTADAKLNGYPTARAAMRAALTATEKP